MLFKDERRLYHLGPSVGLLVDAFQRQNSPPEYLLAPLRRLAEDVGETTYLSTADGLDVVVVASVEGNHAVRVRGLHVGFRGSLHARGSGKLILAYAGDERIEAYLAGGLASPHAAHDRRPRTPCDASSRPSARAATRSTTRSSPRASRASRRRCCRATCPSPRTRSPPRPSASMRAGPNSPRPSWPWQPPPRGRSPRRVPDLHRVHQPPPGRRPRGLSCRGGRRAGGLGGRLRRRRRRAQSRPHVAHGPRARVPDRLVQPVRRPRAPRRVGADLQVGRRRALRGAVPARRAHRPLRAPTSRCWSRSSAAPAATTPSSSTSLRARRATTSAPSTRSARSGTPSSRSTSSATASASSGPTRAGSRSGARPRMRRWTRSRASSTASRARSGSSPRRSTTTSAPRRCERMTPPLAADGRGVIVAIDHPLYSWPCRGLEDREALLRAVVGAGADAVIVTYGTLRDCRDALGRCGTDPQARPHDADARGLRHDRVRGCLDGRGRRCAWAPPQC